MKAFFLLLSLVFSVAANAGSYMVLPAVNGTIASLAGLTENTLTLKVHGSYDDRNLEDREFKIESQLGRDGSFSLPGVTLETSIIPIRLRIAVVDANNKTWFLHKAWVYPEQDDAGEVYARVMQNWRIYQSAPDYGLSLKIPQGDSLNAYMDKVLRRFGLNSASVDWQIEVDAAYIIRTESDNPQGGYPTRWESREPEICYGRSEIGCVGGVKQYFTKKNSSNVRGAIPLRLMRSDSPKMYLYSSVIKQTHQLDISNLKVKLMDRRQREIGTIYLDFNRPGFVDIYEIFLKPAGQRLGPYSASLPAANSSRVRYFRK